MLVTINIALLAELEWSQGRTLLELMATQSWAAARGPCKGAILSGLEMSGGEVRQRLDERRVEITGILIKEALAGVNIGLPPVKMRGRQSAVHVDLCGRFVKTLVGAYAESLPKTKTASHGDCHRLLSDSTIALAALAGFRSGQST